MLVVLGKCYKFLDVFLIRWVIMIKVMRFFECFIFFIIVLYKFSMWIMFEGKLILLRSIYYNIKYFNIYNMRLFIKENIII